MPCMTIDRRVAAEDKEREAFHRLNLTLNPL